jgi:hypothetical protein
MEHPTNKVQDVYSHAVSVTPPESVIVSREHSISSSMNVETDLNLMSGEDSYTCEYPFAMKKHEPGNDEPTCPLRKTRGYFRTCSSNSLHILLNEVVLPVQCIEHMKILPPPNFIYLKTVAGECVHKQVYMNGKGERYIFNDELAKVYLQDIRGLYRYNST